MYNEPDRFRRIKQRPRLKFHKISVRLIEKKFCLKILILIFKKLKRFFFLNKKKHIKALLKKKGGGDFNCCNLFVGIKYDRSPVRSAASAIKNVL